MDFLGSIDDLVDELSGDGEVDTLDFTSGAAPVPGTKHTYNVRDLPIGFAGLNVTALAALATGIVIDAPIKTAFRPDRLVLEHLLAADSSDALLTLRVNDIIIGTIRLNVGSAPVPGRAFAFNAIGTRLKCAVVATPSVFPQVSVTSSNAAATRLEGGFFGPMKRV